MVITPTYRSPPQLWRVALHTICTRLLVRFIKKPDRPRAMIFRTRAPLGDHCGQGRPLDAHVKEEDKYRVQDDVHNRPQPHRHHAHLSKSLGVDEGVHPQADHHKEGAHQVDGHIGVGVGVGGVAGPEQVEHGPLDDQKQGGDRRSEDQEQGKGVSHDPFCFLSVSPSPLHGAQRRAAGAAQIGKAHDNGDHRHCQAQPGEGQVAGQQPQIDAVHHAVQHVDELGQRHGEGQGQNVFGDAPLGKVVCLLCHRPASSGVP